MVQPQEGVKLVADAISRLAAAWHALSCYSAANVCVPARFPARLRDCLPCLVQELCALPAACLTHVSHPPVLPCRYEYELFSGQVASASSESFVTGGWVGGWVGGC